MRNRISSILAVPLLLLVAGSAGAFSINHTTNYDGVSALQTSDTVTVHVFIDSEGAGVETPLTNPGINLMTIGVIYTAPNLVFTGANAGGAYAYLNYYPGAPSYVTATYNGSQSTYLLFTTPVPASGAFPGQPGAVYMIPQQSPWQTWPTPVGELVPGAFCPSPGTCEQVNLNWVPPGLVPDLSAQVRATTNTWLGSIVLHVADTAGGTANTGLFIDGSCCILRTGDGTQHQANTTVDAATSITLPEPTAPALSMAALATLYAIRSRRRSRRRS
jgi:hypothetical protein